MGGQVKPVGVVRTTEGEVVGTFNLVRPDRPGLQFSMSIPANATQDEIGQLIGAKCAQITVQEPPPAMSVLEQMVGSGQSWQIPS